MEGLWLPAAFRSAGACWWLQRAPSVPCTWSHVLGAHGSVTWASASHDWAGLASLCAHPRPQTSAFQLVVVPATSQDCSLPLFIFQPAPAFPQPEAEARGHTEIEHPVQETPRPVVQDPLLPWRRLPVRWHRRTACPRPQRRQAWAGWPQRGRRIGEAQNPGPLLPGTPVGRERSPPRRSQPPQLFCPVPTCPCSDAARARGWATVAPCWLLATGCANCLAPFPQPHSLSCLRSQCLPSPRGPPNLQARGSGSRSGRCHPNGHRRLATPIPFSHPSCQDCHPAACP